MKSFLKKHWTTIILSLVMLAGLCLLLYPTFSDWWNSLYQSRAIATYQEAVKDMSEDEKKAMLEEAHAYNERLAEEGIHFELTEEEEGRYNRILDITGTGIMGYIEVPAIHVDLPIYHGTDETVLQIAIGHLAGSSFPVGGESTHAAVSGHRGLPSARLFTDLDRLKEGDIFTVTVLDQVVTYKVDQIRIVLPEEVSELAITKGEDYMTLITCTPYGVNSHRILVRGVRTANIEKLDLTADARKLPVYLVIPAAGIPILFVLLLVMLLYYQVRPKRMSNSQILETYRKDMRESETKKDERE